MFGHLQMWIKSEQKNENQMLILVKGDPKNTRADFAALPPQYGNDAKVLKRQTVTLCGSQSAQELVAQGNDKSGKRTQIEVMSTIIGANRYVAMYIRPLTLAPDAQAESAIHSLCPVK